MNPIVPYVAGLLHGFFLDKARSAALEVVETNAHPPNEFTVRLVGGTVLRVTVAEVKAPEEWPPCTPLKEIEPCHATPKKPR